MVDLSAITGAISGLKAASDIAVSFKDMHDTATIQEKVIELQSAILSAQTSALNAQSDQATLLEHVRSLEEKMAELEAWNTEKERYQLKDVGEGKFVYILKEGVQPAEPSHQLCANCFQQKKKSILQSETRMPNRADVLVCHNCGSDLYLFGHRVPEHSASSRRRGR